MAQRNDEHRMVFDIRGRRRHVVKFVYAILAVLMALSLFLVTGAVNLGSLFGSSSSASNPAKTFEEQAEKIEARLKKEPESEDLLASLARTRATAGNTLLSGGAGESADGVEEVRTQLNMAAEAWSKYLKATEEPNAGAAQIMAPAFFTLAQASRSNKEVQENLVAAGETEEIVTAARPSLNSWSTLAQYQVFYGDYKGARESTAKATKYANTKFEREGLENKLGELEKSGREFQKALTEEEKAKTESAKAEAGSGGNPLNSLGGTPLGE